MSIAARVRLTLARSPWMYWAIVAGLAATAGLFVMRAGAGVDAARQSWGDLQPVFVARQAIEPGASVHGAVERRRLPAPLIPADAVAHLGEAATARQHIATGEILVTHDVSPHAAPQTLIPDGWLAVAVAEPVATGAGVGDDVTVATGGVVVAAEGTIVGRSGEALLVAVPSEEAAAVAQAAASGDVAVLIRP